MSFVLLAVLVAAVLFGGMLACLEYGRRLGARRIAASSGGTPSGTGPLEGAVFGMLGLLVAFTFGGAVSRFEARRDLIVSEANALETTWLRLDLLPEAEQAPIRALLREYIDTRLSAYALLPDVDAAWKELARSEEVRGRLWRATVATMKSLGGAAPTPSITIPMNELFDLATRRTQAAKRHQPEVVFGMLFAVALGAAIMAGYGMSATKGRNWFHMIGFAGVTAVAVFVTINLEYPRLGLIDIKASDQVLIDVRANMK